MTIASVPRRLVLLAAPLLAAACSQRQLLGAVDAMTADTGTLRLEGAAFGPDPRQKLDLYAPANARAAPVVVFQYGGSWRQGERRQYRFVGEMLARRGLVVLVADYRLAPDARFPAFVEDAALAVRWARDQAGRHGGDPARITLLGHSAGGYNALVAVLDPRHLAAAGLRQADIAQVVALAAPTGAELQRSRRLAPLFATDPQEAAWPITLAGQGAGSAPPILLVAGAGDPIIRASDVRALGAALAAGGNRGETLVLPETDHFSILGDLWAGNPRAEAWAARLGV